MYIIENGIDAPIVPDGSATYTAILRLAVQLRIDGSRPVRVWNGRQLVAQVSRHDTVVLHDLSIFGV